MKTAHLSTGIQFPSPTWESDFEALAFTAEALHAHPDREDEELDVLSRRATAMLVDWEKIDLAGRAARRAKLHTMARIRGADVALDAAIAAFATALLVHVKDKRTDALYTRFFPEPHEDVIDLGVDAEVPAAMLIVMTLDHDPALPDVLRAHQKPLRTAVQMGNSAIQARVEALADIGRHCARIDGWTESAEAMRKTLLRSLKQIAEKRSLPARWVEAFFLASPT